MTKSVVITGSTSGIGLGMAREFLARGCQVTISGRSVSRLDAAAASLAVTYDGSLFQSVLCDVSRYSQVEGLWKAARDRFGRVDIWINNAGSGHAETMIWDYSPELVRDVVDSNVIGAFYGTMAAAKGMRQQGFGCIYNMEGLGSSGPVIKGLALYAMTKSGLAYLTRATANEMKDSPVVVGAIRPGMVATRLITGQYVGHPEEWKRAERIFNILSDRVETVAPWLVDKVLSNKKNGATIRWLTGWKIMLRFAVSPFHRRKIYELT
jgi:NAD(P)-dependent dehydrogenase (short-subunit alcohol dehydrogenase family)